MNGFTSAFGDDLDTPENWIRLSSDQGQGPTATANMAYFESNAQFASTHGEDFKLGESKDLDIANADEAKLTTWTTTTSNNEDLRGAWVFVSQGSTGAAGSNSTPSP